VGAGLAKTHSLSLSVAKFRQKAKKTFKNKKCSVIFKGFNRRK
jgi:hypothetical protein